MPASARRSSSSSMAAAAADLLDPLRVAVRRGRRQGQADRHPGLAGQRLGQLGEEAQRRWLRETETPELAGPHRDIDAVEMWRDRPEPHATAAQDVVGAEGELDTIALLAQRIADQPDPGRQVGDPPGPDRRRRDRHRGPRRRSPGDWQSPPPWRAPTDRRARASADRSRPGGGRPARSGPRSAPARRSRAGRAARSGWAASRSRREPGRRAPAPARSHRRARRGAGSRTRRDAGGRPRARRA